MKKKKLQGGKGDAEGRCGDKLSSFLHNFKYHLQEWDNPGMASTAGGVYSERKPEPPR
jgi:hypothetical protein